MRERVISIRFQGVLSEDVEDDLIDQLYDLVNEIDKADDFRMDWDIDAVTESVGDSQ